MTKRIFADLSLLFVAFIWGTTFVIVQKAVAVLPPHSFNALRFALASIALLIIILLRDKKIPDTGNKGLLKAGAVLGLLLFSGYAFQTVGLLYTSASKAGFITGLSVVLVPLFSIIILKQLPKWTTIVGVVFATVGLYLLTMTKGASLQLGDLLVFFCALFFALQIIYTGKFAPNFDALQLAWVQITVVAALSLLIAVFSEGSSLIRLGELLTSEVVLALIITAVFATALAFVAQTTFQKYTTPTRVAIIFAMEPVFAALTSYVLLDELLSSGAMIGGVLIFLGMILAELKTSS